MKLKIKDNLVLNTIDIPKSTNKVEAPVNHIMVIDCSGSMYNDLPKIRKQLKNKLPSLVKIKDTVSLVWFSGKSQFGTLVDKIVMNDTTSLNNLNTAIDRWLMPMGLTGFVEPLQSIKSIMTDDSTYALYFLTDGYDNTWSESDILDVCKELGNKLSSTIIEYGWNCNRSLLTKMSEELNGSLIFCEDFDKYDPMFDILVTQQHSSKKVEVCVTDAIDNIVFSTSDIGPIQYKVINNHVYVPEDVNSIHYYTIENIVSKQTFAKVNDMELVPVYQSLSIFAKLKKSKFVKDLLFELGDTKLFNAYNNCFGKQNLTDFCTMCVESSDVSRMFSEGRSFDLKSDPNSFTLVDLMFILENDKECLISLKDMKYNKMSKATEKVTISKEDKEKLIEELSKAKSPEDVKAITEKLNSITDNQISFTYDDTKGYPISSLDWHSSRCNVSMKLFIKGSVNIPKNEYNIPDSLDTYIWRNYNVIKDGIANIDTLPVYLSANTKRLLKSLKISMTEEDGISFIHLRSLPTINESMVNAVKAEDYFKLLYSEMKCKATEKVYKAFYEKWFGSKTSSMYMEKYTEEGMEWLKSLGITEFSGYNPKVSSKESSDYYMGVELDAYIKGLKDIPSYNAFMKKIDSKKSLTLGESLLLPAYNECSSHAIDKEWLETIREANKSEQWSIYRKLIEMRFSVIVGQTWFSDIEDSLTINVDGQELVCNASINDVKVEI